MTDELPDWLAGLEEAEDDKNLAPPPKKKRKKRRQKSSSPPQAANKLNSLQIAILGGLVLVMCVIFGGLTAAVYLYQDRLFDTAPQNAAVAVQSPPTPEVQVSPSPTIPPTDIPTPAPTATSMLPQAAPTLEPSPTATYAVAPEFINKDKIFEITVFVESWRDLSLPERIPLEFLTRRQLKEQWRDEAFDAAALEAVKTQQEFYAALGLIEPDVDLVEAILESQSGILLGYYTPDEKIMYIIAESVNMFAQEEMTFAHEYVHALQDYHFDLSKLLIYGEETSADSWLAARALPEGDARAVETLFTMQNINQSELEYSVYRYLFQEQPSVEGVSPALGIFTYFPYTAGEYFIFYLLFEGNFSWDLVNDAYNHPPVSSEQVMHPEKYLAGEMPTPITLPDLATTLGEGWRELDQNVLGEIGFLVWLIDKTDELTAADGAAGWDGDRYTLWVNEANKQRVLAESAVWETENDAIELYEAFSEYMNLREGQDSSYQEGQTRFWAYDEGVTLLTRNGRHVLIIIGPDRPTLDRVRQQLNF